MSKGFIVLGHGSKVPETIGILENITGSLRKRLKYAKVSYAALQFNEPDLPGVIASMSEDGVTDIIIVPLFLVDGNHIREDIPEIIREERSKYPSLNIRLANHIGADMRITDILIDRIIGLTDNNGGDASKLSAPEKIEEESFRIIEASIDLSGFDSREKAVVTRMLHASGDLSLADAIVISDSAVGSGIKALKEGRAIVTDVHMVETGISRRLAALHNNEILCRVDDEAVAADAKRLGKTRSAVAMRSLAARIDGGVVVIGNAPTALAELLKMVEEGAPRPALVIGTPVGFVGAAESKEALIRSGLSHVSIRGTRGGSALAVAAVNAILKLATTDDR